MAALSAVYRNAFYKAVPCEDCDIPGYLIFLPISSPKAFEDLTAAAQASFGGTMSLLESTVASVTRCERVYILRFSEGLASVHFHIFPRTAELGRQFRDEMKFTEPGLNGELLFYWARKRFKINSPSALSLVTTGVADKIRQALADK